MCKMPLTVVATVACSGALVNAASLPTAFGNVTYIEGSYVPDALYFKLDQPAANCPAGAFLVWQGGPQFPRGTSDDSMRRASVRFMAQTLQLQKTIGAKVVVFAASVASGTQYCNVENIHLPESP